MAGLSTGMDSKACAAYLTGYLAWELALVLAGMRLGGVGVPDLGSSSIAAGLEPYEVNGVRAVRVCLRLLDSGRPHVPLDEAGLAALIAACFEPLVGQLHQASRLGRSAIWRIVADNIAAAWLTVGKELGRAEQAMADANAVIHAPGSPLSNKQMHFIKVEAQDPAQPERLIACEWFRARGGCCRYYTTDESGGEVCSTCVLRSPQSMHDELADYLHERALAKN
jgi:hypothetical protein